MSDQILAVPAPVLPPSAEEKQAIAGLTFKTEAEIEANAARLRAEGAEMKRINQGEVAVIDAAIAEDRSVHERLAEMQRRIAELKALKASSQ